MNPNNSSDYIWGFLTDPRNIGLALTLEDYIPQLRLFVFRKFWANIQKLLEQKSPLISLSNISLYPSLNHPFQA